MIVFEFCIYILTYKYQDFEWFRKTNFFTKNAIRITFEREWLLLY